MQARTIIDALRRRTRRRARWRAARRALAGAGAGALAMYVFDPGLGRRRRSRLRDAAEHELHVLRALVRKSSREIAARAQGMAAERRARRRDAAVDDEVLVARVRSRLGRLVSHPGAIEVSVEGGRLRLRGHVLAREARRLRAQLRQVPGIVAVDDALEVHATADRIADLQGGTARAGQRMELFQERWSPATQLAAGTAGAGMLVWAARRRGILGAGLGVAGALALARGVFNEPVLQLLGVTRRGRTIEIQRTITVNAPVEEVFEFWSKLENLPRFMSHVRSVRRRAPGRYRWTVSGPAGLPVSWDAEIVRLVPERELAWRSVPGSLVANVGVTRFEALPDGSTRMDIKLSYTPPAGVLGHAVATLFRKDPRHAMDDDLVRFKSLLEQGRTRAHGVRVTLDEVRTGTPEG